MMGLAEFHFLRPWWWLALIPLLAGLIWFARRPVGMQIWKKVVEPHLMPHVLIGSDAKRRRWPLFAMALAGVLACAAAAGPTWDRLPQPVFRSDDALVIALDLSRSMDAEDVSPSRLQRARFKINDILNDRPEGQTALIVYAAEPFIVSPLTNDVATIISQLPVLTTDLPPAQGSRVDRALEVASDLLQQSGARSGQVLVVTDGAKPETALPAATELRQAGYRVSVLGVGTQEGGPIPGRGGFVKDSGGAIVVARLDTDDLQKLAGAGGGQYFAPTTDDRDIDRFLSTLTPSASATEDDSELGADVWRDQGFWLLLPLLPLVALAFRRGFLLSLSFLFILPFPRAEAFEWKDLWKTPDQQASEALERGDADSAAGLFEDSAWRAAAEYRAGQYEQSLSALSDQSGVDALYNRGNALARLGRFDEAIDAYEQAIEIETDHEDAIYNRDLLLDMQKQQQDQQQQEGEQGESQDQQQDGEQGDSKEQQDGEQGEQGEPGESQDQQQQAGEQGDSQDQQQSGQSGEQEESPEDVEALSAAEQAQRDQAEEQFREQMREAAERAAEKEADETETADAIVQALAQQTEETIDEAQQAVEQWLRQVPDDPGGLLRRKFERQHQLYRMERGHEEEIEQW